MSEIFAVEAVGLEKHYGATHALAGLDLEVARGTILGVLGPNGAGKTTAVRILTTLLRPERGTARVAGFDVVREAPAVRRCIGLTGQYAALDDCLTARANLVMVGQLTRLSARDARRRADELLARFDLSDAATRAVKTYSGGMRRRLDLAASLVANPEILFLDEPTTGLDLRSRMVTWDAVRSLVDEGKTVLLTTQYLDEADQLADRIAVIDHGRVIADGTSAELKARIGGERIEIVVAPGSDLDTARRTLALHADGPPVVDLVTRRIVAPVPGGARRVAVISGDLDAAGVLLDDFGVHRPTLDDVFLSVTGRPSGEAQPGDEHPNQADNEEALV